MSRFIVNGIRGDMFDEHAGRTALFCNGLPGAIGPLPGVLFAATHGWDVLFPQYPGTYDSDGELTVSAAARALGATMRAATAGNLQLWSGETMEPLPPIGLAVAHSFGALVLAECLRAYPDLTIPRILLLAPVISYSAHAGTRESLGEHLQMVRASRPRTYRLGDSQEWERVANGYFIEPPRMTHDGRILAIFGSNDDTFDIDVVRATFASTIRNAFGAEHCETIIVDGAGHAMHDLLANQPEATSFIEAR